MTQPHVEPLLEPRDGIPPVIETWPELSAAVDAFARGTGPVAMDAERASGYRYSGRAYLVQLRREGAGTALIDPVACPDLGELDRVLADAEIVLHAATQDLPCLAELGFRPRRLFDTELAARLLGYERVGLATMVEVVLGLRLEKGHSAADWSRRPLPEDWLRYAALDVEVLVELRDALYEQLVESGKLEWALEEFAAILSAPASPPKSDPWRRTSGIHRVRSLRGLAIVRELWTLRDEIAREADLAPGRVLPDSAIVQAALEQPRTTKALTEITAFTGRSARRHLREWLDAVNRGRTMPESALPQPAPPGNGPPPTNRWADRDPAAAKRLAAARTVLAGLSEEHRVPVENLLPPDAVRKLTWSPPAEITTETVADRLRELGARRWQVALTAGPLAAELARLAG
ncbi:3'-5' exonuclease [Thermobispora bispora]|uniref:3'-5' exonuclease n=1 Tax=Thermobispora bispora (strain ATCC 19993 / DSM 43833 / CBS 139.67 / JCM 10125 / KCTC 9307 / NBRC 14880 / R51) TaxID=469371 RepID=D6Y3A1_THEBD|nr:ribonuclease D [Thermobispora bispora]MBO2474669.1 ribonuclease D [Actinomycetales bacterium]MDI9581588.1 ribonuclease D [Thermobispora sp.]ADG88976.1 3'-5' exonuclease [Thermobispora bispora DSM 43833]MBX6168914.1 ribonuclease D [Thermobispora bispora]QSI48712.1 ribonuclease D [Thermobispora bispora]